MTQRGAVVALAGALALAALPVALPAAEWRRAETGHFQIVYETKDQATADELAAICEDVYAKVTGFFRSYPAKVPVVIRGRLDYANGLSAVFPARLELIVTAPSWPWMGSRTESWMRVLLTHELAHFVQLGMDRGVFHGLSKVFGGDARFGPGIFLPGWLVEGPPIALETRFSGGGRGRNAFHEALYKAPVMEGRLFSLAQASYSSAFPPSGRHWVAGWMLVDHLLRAFGEDVVLRIMDDFLAFPFFGPWAAIERVTGKTARDVFADMKAELEDRYGPAGAVTGGARISPGRVGDWQHPVPTARGLYAYRSDLEGYPAIVRLAADGSEQAVARIGLTDPSSFTATAGGETIYAASFFADWRPGDGEIVLSDLSAVDTATGKTRRITTGARLWHPAVSPDGSRLAAVQADGSYTRLVEVDPADGGTRVLFSVERTNVFNPAFSPDGRRIAFVVNRLGVQDVVVIDGAGAAVPVTGPDPYGEYFPAWRDDDHLLFCSDRTGSLALYEADLAAGTIALLQQDPVAAYEGVIDGGSLVYGSYGADGYCLKRAAFAPDTGTAVAVEPATAAAAAPAPAPIASERFRDTARPCLWYPLVTLGSGTVSGWDIGVGAEVLAGSLVGTAAWSAGAAWHPLTGQPEISLALSRSIGSATLDAWNATGYQARPGTLPYFALTSATGIGVSVPIVSSSAYGRGTSLSASLDAVLTSRHGDTSTFDLFEALGAGTWEHSLRLGAGLSFSRSRAGGPIDFLSPWIVRASARAETVPPWIDGAAGTRITLAAQAGAPVVPPHLLVRAGLKAAWGTGSLESAGEGFAVARGLFDAEARPLPGRLLGGVDLLAPIALLDQPLLFGVALLGLAAGVHVEAAADWDLDPSAFAVPWIYAGAEVVLQLGAGGLEAPVGIGVSARFDPTGARAFDIGGDLRPYFFLSFDSFRDAAAGGPLRPRPLASTGIY